MKVDDLSIGSAIVLGNRYPGNRYSRPMHWVKISDDNRFMCELIERWRFDNREPNNAIKAIRERGNNLFPYSSLCQWLNAEQEAGWFTPACEGDTCDMEQDRGFLSLFTPQERDLMVPQHVVTVVPESLKKRYGETIEKDMLVTIPAASEIQEGYGDRREGIHNFDVECFLAGRQDFWTRTSDGLSVLCKPVKADSLRSKSPSEDRRYVFPIIRLKGDAKFTYSDTTTMFRYARKLYESAEADEEFINNLYALLAV